MNFQFIKNNVIQKLGLLVLCAAISGGVSAEVSIDQVSMGSFTDNAGNIKLTFSGPTPEYKSFTINNPPRLAIDFLDSKIGDIDKKYSVGSASIRDVNFVEASGRVRMVISMSSLLPYEVTTDNNEVSIVFNKIQTDESTLNVASGQLEILKNAIQNIDFRRGHAGQGVISIKMSDPSSVVDLERTKGVIELNMIGASLPAELERRLDVADFATNVLAIDSYNTDQGVRISIKPTGEYDYVGYQTGSVYTVEVKAVDKEVQEAQRKDKYGYVGERLSLNFQNIEVRAVLQLLADFTGLNVVASDTVQGNITLRLKNVPWDQALDIILKTRGLGMRKTGNVLLIAPNEEIAAREKQELQASQQVQDLSPLSTEYFEINYAKASDIAELLKGEGNSLLSERGSVSIDERTNTLMVLETTDKHDEVRQLINKLDIPVRQVLIESRIVIANDDFSRGLGVRSGVTYIAENGSDGIISTAGSAAGTATMTNSIVNNLSTTGQPYPVELPDINDRLNVNLPAIGSAGQIALAILGSDYLVDLELSALQTEGNGEVVSSPRVITSNQKEALIEQGVEIPYQEASSSGATSVSFKKAVLSLSVTPQITPDDKVIMDLKVNKDSVGEIVSGIPTINTRAVQTQVLVNNGDTVVLGGIYEQTRAYNEEKVPLLGDIPVLGYLFKRTTKADDKAELLIFVTPKILKEELNIGLN